MLLPTEIRDQRCLGGSRSPRSSHTKDTGIKLNALIKRKYII